MSYAVRVAPSEHFEWLCERVGCSPTPAFQAIEVIDRNGKILGMSGYDFWTPNSVQMSVALGSHIAGRALLRLAFEYPFVQQNRGLVIAYVSAKNSEALRLDASLGFRETHRIVDGHSMGVDLVLLEMRKHECRWISQPQELLNG